MCGLFMIMQICPMSLDPKKPQPAFIPSEPSKLLKPSEDSYPQNRLSYIISMNVNKQQIRDRVCLGNNNKRISLGSTIGMPLCGLSVPFSVLGLK